MRARHILVADDDPRIRRLISTTLEDVAAFTLVQACDGVAALAAATATPPEVVFLDIDMPRMNGIDACRALRGGDAGEKAAAATIVILTAASDDGAQARADAAGAHLSLPTPSWPLDVLRLAARLGARR